MKYNRLLWHPVDLSTLFFCLFQNISASHHVIAVDFPGHGFTMEPLHGEEVSLESIVRRLKQVNKCSTIYQSILRTYRGAQKKGLYESWNCAKIYTVNT